MRGIAKNVWAASLLALAALPCESFAQTFTGTVARIQDGDTFDLCDVAACHRIRICGIDAPERRQPGAQAATDALGAIVKNQTVRCVQVGSGTVCDGRSRPTNRNRYVAQCFVANDDIADVLVKDGHACDWVRFSGGHYSRGGQGKQCGPRGLSR